MSQADMRTLIGVIVSMDSPKSDKDGKELPYKSLVPVDARKSIINLCQICEPKVKKTCARIMVSNSPVDDTVWKGFLAKYQKAMAARESDDEE